VQIGRIDFWKSADGGAVFHHACNNFVLMRAAVFPLSSDILISGNVTFMSSGAVVSPGDLRCRQDCEKFQWDGFEWWPQTNECRFDFSRSTLFVRRLPTVEW
jgi:hypothetical protein